MGTRGAYGFIKGGKYKVTYNHFDSYPTGLGNDILKFLHANTVEELNQLYDEIVMVNQESSVTKDDLLLYKAQLEKIDAIDLSVSSQSETDWYCLLRGAQGDLFKLKECKIMIDSQDFLEDELFCEYAYIIDLDSNVLKLKGGRKTQEFLLNNLPEKFKDDSMGEDIEDD